MSQKIWHVWVEQHDISGQWYWVPIIAPGDTAEEAIDFALRSFDVRNMERGCRLHSVRVWPHDDRVEMQLEPNPVPAYRRSDSPHAQIHPKHPVPIHPEPE